MQVDSKQVVSVVFNDIATCLSTSVATVRSALTKSGFGKTHITKDFLSPGSECLIITRGVNNRRRKCDVIFSENISPDNLKKLKEGLCILFSVTAKFV